MKISLWQPNAWFWIFFQCAIIRGGPNFDPVKYVKEVNHVKHMHADSLLIHPNFSKLMITWLNFIETPLLIHFQTDRKLTHNSWSRDWQTVRKLTFDPPLLVQTGPKVSRHESASRNYLLHILYWIKTFDSKVGPTRAVIVRTIRREIICSIRICSRNFDSVHAFGKKIDLKNLRGRNSKIFTPENQL